MNWFFYVFLKSIALSFYYFHNSFYIVPTRKRMPKNESNKDNKISEKMVNLKRFRTCSV